MLFPIIFLVAFRQKEWTLLQKFSIKPPVITEIEALSWVSDNKEKEEIIKQFISYSKIINLSQSIIKKTISIRRNRKIKTPDAIIASTAIVNNLILLSSDSGFINIEGLNLINPNEIK
jgi:predicted nucleic acid-binding protein